MAQKPDTLFTIETMAEWVASRDNPHWYERMTADEVAALMPPAGLFFDLSLATVALSGPLPEAKREQWEEARGAICKALGECFASLGHKVNETAR